MRMPYRVFTVSWLCLVAMVGAVGLTSAADEAGEKIGDFLKYANGTALDTRTNLMWMTQDFRNLEGRPPESWFDFRRGNVFPHDVRAAQNELSVRLVRFGSPRAQDVVVLKSHDIAPINQALAGFVATCLLLSSYHQAPERFQRT